MKNIQRSMGVATLALLVSACATPPMGPRVAVMPGPNKPFDVFQEDQTVCEQYASQQVGGQASAANDQAIGGAVLGTILGAGLGAAIGGGEGAAIGAAGGALTGTAVGAGGSQRSEGGIQGQYDIAYSQCMYSRGNQVPGYASAAPRRAPPAYGPPAYPPPQPPPGY